MNDTPDLFDPPVRALEHDPRLFAQRDAAIARKANPMPVARASDPETSHIAAANASSRSMALRRTALTLLALRAHTDFELAAATGTQQTSVGVRRHELVKMGYVRASRDALNRVRTRPAPSGSPAMIWEITELGRQYLAESK